MAFSNKLKDIFRAKTPEEFFAEGGLTITAQALIGGHALALGGCAIVDGIMTSNRLAKSLYFTGGTIQLISGVSLMTYSVLFSICPPIGVVSSSIGWVLSKVGSNIINSANTVNPE